MNQIKQISNLLESIQIELKRINQTSLLINDKTLDIVIHNMFNDLHETLTNEYTELQSFNKDITEIPPTELLKDYQKYKDFEKDLFTKFTPCMLSYTINKKNE